MCNCNDLDLDYVLRAYVENGKSEECNVFFVLKEPFIGNCYNYNNINMQYLLKQIFFTSNDLIL